MKKEKETEAKRTQKKEEPKASKGIDAIMNFGIVDVFDTFLEDETKSSGSKD